jgi:hypothetical protein
VIAARPSREAVARWNGSYAEQTAALFAAMRSTTDIRAIRRLARAYREVAGAWRILAADLGAPLWARHAASVAAEEFERRAGVEDIRAEQAGPSEGK